MTGAENSTVSITIAVTDNGSVTLIDAAAAKFAGLNNVVESSAKQLSSFGMAGVNAGAGISTLGQAFSGTVQSMSGLTGATAEWGNALEGVKGSIREVGGLGREMGLHLDYSMKHAIADNEMLMAG